MTEEQVTKTIINYLNTNKWNIITFDFPQSGTGKILLPNESIGEKNKDGFIPDIVTVKNGICLFFENKHRFYLKDFQKISSLINNNVFSNSIANLLKDNHILYIYYGIGLPLSKWSSSAKTNASLVDFIFGVSLNSCVEILYNPHDISV